METNNIYSDTIIDKKGSEKYMKKVLLGIMSVAVVVVGLIVIWKFIIPFIGSVLAALF